MNKIMIYRPFCFFAFIALFLAFLPGFSVSAERLTEEEYYMYWYAENYLGVDWSQYSSTDDGSTMEEYTERHGNKSFSQGIDDVAYEVSSSANTFYSKVYENTKDTVNKYYTTSAKAAEYVGEKATRTLQTAAGTAWSVAGGEFWESVFNDLFNNYGYKEQYVVVPGTEYTGTTSNGKEWFIEQVNVGNYSTYGNQYTGVFVNGSSRYEAGGGFRMVLRGGDKNNSNNVAFYDFHYSDPGTNYAIGMSLQNCYLSSDKSRLLFDVVINQVQGTSRIVTYSIDFITGIYGNDDIKNNSSSVLLPEQVGFIKMPDGSIVPVYTDKTRNNFDINDNGTVTLPDGSILPIYVYPDQINPDGQTQILKFINGLPFQLPFGLNDSLPISSGDDGTFLEGLGQLIGDVFSGLLDGLLEVIKTIADAIKTLVGLIAGLFKGDYYNNLKFQLFDFNPFDIIQSGVSKIFEIFGVVIS